MCPELGKKQKNKQKHKIPTPESVWVEFGNAWKEDLDAGMIVVSPRGSGNAEIPADIPRVWILSLSLSPFDSCLKNQEDFFFPGIYIYFFVCFILFCFLVVPGNSLRDLRGSFRMLPGFWGVKKKPQKKKKDKEKSWNCPKSAPSPHSRIP